MGQIGDEPPTQDKTDSLWKVGGSLLAPLSYHVGYPRCEYSLLYLARLMTHNS